LQESAVKTHDVDAERNRLKLEIRYDSMKFNEIDCANVVNKHMCGNIAFDPLIRSLARYSIL